MTTVPANPSLPPKSRNSNLDLLRFLSITSVVLHHLCRLELLPAGDPILMERLGPFAAPQWTIWSPLQGGWAGVDLFFVMSGWLVGGLYWKEVRLTGDLRIGSFLMRRFLRTIPPYLVMLHFAWGLKFWFGKSPPAYDPGYLFFLQNYYSRMPYFQVSWSLCVEEHFYVILVSVLAVARKAPRMMPTVFAALVTLPLLTRIAFTPSGVGFSYYTTATHLRLDGIFMGVWAAYLFHNKPASFDRLAANARRLLPFAFLYFFFPFALTSDWHNIVGRTFLSAACLCMVLSAATARRVWLPWFVPVCSRVALWSFSIYLCHGHVIHIYERLIIPRVPLPGILHEMLLIGLITAGGYVFHMLFERPVLRLRDVWSPRGKSASISQPTAAP